MSHHVNAPFRLIVVASLAFLSACKREDAKSASETSTRPEEYRGCCVIGTEGGASKNAPRERLNNIIGSAEELTVARCILKAADEARKNKSSLYFLYSNAANARTNCETLRSSYINRPYPSITIAAEDTYGTANADGYRIMFPEGGVGPNIK